MRDRSYRSRPDIGNKTKTFILGEPTPHLWNKIKRYYLPNHGIVEYGYYDSSKYEYCLYGATGLEGTLNFAVYA